MKVILNCERYNVRFGSRVRVSCSHSSAGLPVAEIPGVTGAAAAWVGVERARGVKRDGERSYPCCRRGRERRG